MLAALVTSLRRWVVRVAEVVGLVVVVVMVGVGVVEVVVVHHGGVASM